MIFDILTIFPSFFDSPLKEGVIHKAIEADLLKIRTLNLRDYTHDRHRTTDDRPYGGGEGMVMKIEPLFKALEDLKKALPAPKVILMSPRGQVLKQNLVEDLAKEERLIIICGRYEGVDERFIEHCVDLELSIGDYILSGGETAALVVIEAVSRLIPGVLGCPASPHKDSFSNGLLEYPHYTRPADFKGWRVPDVLLSGDHKKIEKWRRQQSLKVTYERRPDLLKKAPLSIEDIKYLKGLGWKAE